MRLIQHATGDSRMCDARREESRVTDTRTLDKTVVRDTGAEHAAKSRSDSDGGRRMDRLPRRSLRLGPRPVCVALPTFPLRLAVVPRNGYDLGEAAYGLLVAG